MKTPYLFLLPAALCLAPAWAIRPIDARLLIAVHKGQPQTVAELIAYGANVNVSDAEYGHNTPLHLAAIQGHGQTAQVLIDSGAFIDACAGNYTTPLYCALLHKYLKTARVLLRNGADANAVIEKNMGLTMLHLFSANGDLEAVRCLLEHGANVNILASGATPLMQAAFHWHAACVRHLLEHGADASLRNEKGMTAADLAEQAGQRECAVYLKSLQAQAPVAQP